MNREHAVPLLPPTSGEGCCAPSGRDGCVGCMRDDASHLVRMREKQNMASQDPRRALHCYRSLNGVGGVTNHVEHEARVGEHGDVAALYLIGGGTHAFCHKAL